IGKDGGEAEGTVLVPWQLDRLLVALPVFPFVAGAKDVHVAAAAEATVLLGIPAELPGAAAQAVGPAVLLRLLVVDLDVPLQARGWLGHREGVDLVARGPTNRALARHRLPYLRMRLLHRLWEHADLLQG